jgi:DinB family protein
MKNLRMIFLLVVLCFAVGAFGQGTGSTTAKPPQPGTPQTSGATQQAPQPQPPLTTIAAIVDREVSNYEKLMVGAAEAMPEDKFNFTPASLNIPGAEYKDVRTFAVLIKHTAAANFFFWTKLTGEKMPENIKGGNGPDELKTKAEIVQFLKDSFAVGHRAAKTLTPENATEQITFMNNTSARLYLATNAVIHDADEYGQMVEYLRMNGIVPPASRGKM